MDLIKHIFTVNNYPKDGISFKDITPLIANGKALRYAIEKIVEFSKLKDVDVVAGPEARGFILGCPVAYSLNVGFVPIRKKGKLPREVIEAFCQKEYGQDILTIHRDSIKKDQRVLLVDDVLATGGTIKSSIDLIDRLDGNIVGAAFLGQIKELKGLSVLKGIDTKILLDL